MTTNKWYFLNSGTGRMSADVMANPLKNTPLTKAEVLVRESLQNSYDERVDDLPLTFKIKRYKFTGEAKSNLLKELAINEIEEKSKMFDKAHNWFSRAKKV